MPLHENPIPTPVRGGGEYMFYPGWQGGLKRVHRFGGRRRRGRAR